MFDHLVDNIAGVEAALFLFSFVSNIYIRWTFYTLNTSTSINIKYFSDQQLFLKYLKLFSLATVSYQPSHIGALGHYNNIININSNNTNLVNTNQTVSNVSILLDSLLKDYDNSLRPDFGGDLWITNQSVLVNCPGSGGAVLIEVNIQVRSMGPISEMDMVSCCEKLV